jgi:SAM-dependent methyltransferase
MNLILEILFRPLFNFEDFLFEVRYGVNFGNLINKKFLDTPYINSIYHATAYDPIWCRNLRDIFSVVKKQKTTLHNFIDIGCGMGKPSFYAHTKYPFKCIIGIDLSPTLINRAKKNLSASNVFFNCEDAQFFKIPSGNSLIFLFNPFDEVIFHKFIKNNRDHFIANESFIAYAQDNHRHLLIENGFKCIYRNPSQALSIYKYC